MKIDFRAHGGFAGMNIDARAETSAFPAEQLAELERLIESSGFFETKQGWFHSPRTGPGEVATYRLKLEDEERKNTLSFSDLDMPPEMSKLFNFVLQLANQSRPRD